MATATTHAIIGAKSHAWYRNARSGFVDAVDCCACAPPLIAAVFGCLLRVFFLLNVNLWLVMRGLFCSAKNQIRPYEG